MVTEKIKHAQLSITTPSNTGTTDSLFPKDINGEIYAVGINYDSLAPGTMDVTFSCSQNGITQTFFTITDNNTDGWWYPRTLVWNNNTEAYMGGSQVGRYVIDGTPRVAITTGGTGLTHVFHILYK